MSIRGKDGSMDNLRCQSTLHQHEKTSTLKWIRIYSAVKDTNRIREYAMKRIRFDS